MSFCTKIFKVLDLLSPDNKFSINLELFDGLTIKSMCHTSMKSKNYFKEKNLSNNGKFLANESEIPINMD